MLLYLTDAWRRVEVNYVLAGLGVAESLAGQTLDRRGVLQGAQRGVQFPGRLRFLVNFFFQIQLVATQALVLLDDGLVPKEHAHQAGDDEQRQHQAEQFVPNALTLGHFGDSITVGQETKEEI